MEMDKKAILSLDLKTDNADDLFRALCLGSRVDYNAFCSDGSVSFLTNRLGIHKSGSGNLENASDAEKIVYDGLVYMLGNSELSPVTDGGSIILGKEKGQMDWGALFKQNVSDLSLAERLNNILSRELLCDITCNLSGCIPECYRDEFEKYNLGVLVSGEGNFDECSVKTLVDMIVKASEIEFQKCSTVANYRLSLASKKLGHIEIGTVAFRNKVYTSQRDIDKGIKRVLRRTDIQDILQTIQMLCSFLEIVLTKRLRQVDCV